MNREYKQTRILLFAKLPRLGKVKTRLLPALSAEQALAVYCQLLEHSLTMLRDANLCPVELWFDAQPDPALAQRFMRKFGPISISVQRGKDLGRRMQHAIRIVKHEAEKVVLIGVDCPAIDQPYLATAIARLDNSTAAVFGPATDGGYVLLATQTADLPIFDGVEWGSNKVMQQTRQLLRRQGINWYELPSLPDIDRPEDIDTASRYGIRVPLAAPK